MADDKVRIVADDKVRIVADDKVRIAADDKMRIAADETPPVAGERHRGPSPRHPTFSVIVPTYARPRQLRECLFALTELDYPTDRYEVIVVDDGGPEPLDPVVAPFRDGIRLRLYRQANAGPGVARNTGARRADGDLLAFTDDDCQPHPAWLAELGELFGRDRERLVGGRTINRLTDNSFAAASQLIVEAAYDHHNRDPLGPRFFASNNMAVPADRFLRLGGFDPRFRTASEDRDFCSRWSEAGYRMAYAPDAIVLHAHELTFPRFCRQHFNYGRGASLYHDVRARRGSGRSGGWWKAHPRLLASLGEPLKDLGLRRAIPIGALLVLWQLANALGFGYERWLEAKTTWTERLTPT